MKKNLMIKISVLSLIILLVGFSTFYLIQQNKEPYPIIDAHMHMYQWDKYGDPPSSNSLTGNVPGARTDEEAIDNYLGMMDKYNIVLGVGSGEEALIEKWKSYAPNKFLAGIEFPKYTTSPNIRLEKWIDSDDLRELYENETIDIIGEVTAQYAGIPFDDPKLEGLFALAEELDIPMQLHSGTSFPMSPYKGDPEFRMRYGNPLALEDYLVKYPRARVYIAHGGYPFLEDTIALLQMYQQVYVDISAINWMLPEEEFYNYLERLVNAGIEDRIMYGSDQMIWQKDAVEISIERIKSADFLTEEQKQNIFFDNAATFFRLDKDEIIETGVVDLSAKMVPILQSTLELRPRTPGANETIYFDLDLEGIKSTAIQIIGFDIDAVEETVMTINGQEVTLPEEIVADLEPRTVTIELEDGLLKNGENEINFLFAEAVEGTTGFSIYNLNIILRK